MMAANDIQVGGDHYKKGGEEHWDRAWRLKYDCFQYIITKWVERWRDKGGLEDLKKAHHALGKYIEVVEAEQPKSQWVCAQCDFPTPHIHRGGGIAVPLDGSAPGPGYVNQDR